MADETTARGMLDELQAVPVPRGRRGDDLARFAVAAEPAAGDEAAEEAAPPPASDVADEAAPRASAAAPDVALTQVVMPDGRPFRFFDPDHRRALAGVARRLMDEAAAATAAPAADAAETAEAADAVAAPGEAAPEALAAPAVEAVQRAALAMVDEGMPAEVVRKAVHAARVHEPVLKRLGTPLPLEVRAPHRAVPSEATDRPPSTPEEHLRAFREDPALNDHHEQWHIVYVLGAALTGRRRTRQGEMFLFMHQQKLARYDTERLAAGVDPVVALDDYDQPLEGYDPTGSGPLPPDIQATNGARPDGATIAATDLVGLLARRRALEADIAAYTPGAWGTEVHSDMDHLGSLVESSALADGTDPGSHVHNAGHGAIAGLSDPPGVMADPDSSMRDPVFWRWHRHVDQYGYELSTRLPAHRLADVEPAGIALAGPAPLAVVPADRLPAGLRAPSRAGVAAHYEQARPAIAAFVTGDFDGLAGATAELTTWYSQREIVFPDEREDGGVVVPGARIPLWALDHEDFVLAARVENTTGEPVPLTLRWFLCPEAKVDDRRWWFELDKQVYEAPPGTSVAVQPATELASVRKPARRLGVDPDDIRPDAPGSVAGFQQSFCNCGLPYTLVLPRGTEDGMAFRVACVVTDNREDRTATSRCGSMTYCGSVDDYPDVRPMGFPFDRDVDGDVLSGPNRASTAVTVRHLSGGDPLA